MCIPGDLCTLFQSSLTEASIAAPSRGAIVAWSLAGAQGQFALRVVRPTGSGNYAGAGTGAQASIAAFGPAQTFTLPTPLPVEAGDAIAIDLASMGANLESGASSVDEVSVWDPTLPQGGTGLAPGPLAPAQLLFNATELLAPAVSAVSPAVGPTTGGATVTITGSSLANATAVRFGSTAAASVTSSENSITAVAPAGVAGPVDITVTTAGGTSDQTSADRFSYLAAPQVTRVSPATGTQAGGTGVLISGTSFTDVSAVHFGSQSATFAQTSAGDVLAVAPRATSPGDVDITVTTPGGTSSKTTTDRFTYVAATSCKVPKLLGKSLTAARKLLKRAHCATGKIKHRGRHVHKPVVVAQSPKAGAKRAGGTKVTLTLGARQKR
jgi:hypothetical protein